MFDLRAQRFISFGSSGLQPSHAHAPSMKSVTRRGHLQRFANGFDPESVTVLIDKALMI
jgi:hypothetical protein